MYDLVSTQLYLDNAQVFDVLENIVIMAVIPISTFVVVVVATSATVVQLKRVIVWRQRASANIEGTEVVCVSCLSASFYITFARCSEAYSIISFTEEILGMRIALLCRDHSRMSVYPVYSHTLH